MNTIVIAPPPRGFGQMLVAGFQASVLSVALIAAINTGIAAVLWIDDTRPFWHPFVTCQLYGFSIAYCVNAASPWQRSNPIRRLALAVASGVLIGVALVIVVKGYDRAWIEANLSRSRGRAALPEHSSIFTANRRRRHPRTATSARRSPVGWTLPLARSRFPSRSCPRSPRR
jgi:hypothetical protein